MSPKQIHSLRLDAELLQRVDAAVALYNRIHLKSGYGVPVVTTRAGMLRAAQERGLELIEQELAAERKRLRIR